jgi:hypothetical protein
VKEIIFSSAIADLIEKPTPALVQVPKIYKEMASSFEEKNPYHTATIKKCIPFLDALTMGYTINTPVDYLFTLKVEIEGNKKTTSLKFDYSESIPPKFEGLIGMSEHKPQQVPKDLRSNYRTVDAVPKLINPWKIITPPGYSCIFTSPFNRNSPFKIVDGVVDTDTYDLKINFPFYWTQSQSIEQTLLPKGTPIALVIPFKRENWKMKIEQHDLEDEEKANMRLGQYIIDKYKRIFWKKKSFR